ncbi:Protein of unknown function [Butyrivibrio sp. INlla18]|uniref:DUF3048 domain-containing protein n=1 Tax=Butyrivibrio sp. INlla18 TaxID=1520806 RepID=UPI0008850F52|nr:DUF3048 domain-containing protein [Butyrivibrio sp. INlla18]SDA47597.1 Protein of unknown function [Butyrivibrio sp. INlla18]
MFNKTHGKKALAAILSMTMILSVAACGKTDGNTNDDAQSEVSYEKIEANDAATESTTEEAAADEAYVLPDDMYFSELTGEPISKDIQDQRPIAAMVDNELTALPHYGTAQADVVYELMNSTKNDRITRLMCVVKDWNNVEQLGSIRSTRPTNILLASEWNAILCHDGGPYHNDAYFAKDWAKDHLSGVFSRVNNGKKREFTEYILSGDMNSQIEKYNISATYNEFANEGSHFNFVPYGTEINLDEKYDRSYTANKVSLPFKHNGSTLTYNAETGMYEYSEYGEPHEDEDSGEVLAFKNVILQKCSFTQLDENGYLIYNCIGSGENAWYLTNGVAKDITWVKSSETAVTKFYDENGEELQINTGKTYIALIPDDTWDKVIFE